MSHIARCSAPGRSRPLSYPDCVVPPGCFEPLRALIREGDGHRALGAGSSRRRAVAKIHVALRPAPGTAAVRTVPRLCVPSHVGDGRDAPTGATSHASRRIRHGQPQRARHLNRRGSPGCIKPRRPRRGRAMAAASSSPGSREPPGCIELGHAWSSAARSAPNLRRAAPVQLATPCAVSCRGRTAARSAPGPRADSSPSTVPRRPTRGACPVCIEPSRTLSHAGTAVTCPAPGTANKVARRATPGMAAAPLAPGPWGTTRRSKPRRSSSHAADGRRAIRTRPLECRPDAASLAVRRLMLGTAVARSASGRRVTARVQRVSPRPSNAWNGSGALVIRLAVHHPGCSEPLRVPSHAGDSRGALGTLGPRGTIKVLQATPRVVPRQ